MGFQLRGTTQPVKAVSASLDGAMPGKGKTVKVEAKPKAKKEKK
jgi:hypothetical protein